MKNNLKKRKLLLQFFSLSFLPIYLLSSCSIPGDDKPVKLDKTVFEVDNKNAFNDIFNLLSKEDGESSKDSFIKKTVDEINMSISEEISKNSLLQEKLRIYFFVSIYNSLHTVIDIVDDKVEGIELIGNREIGVEALKKIIDGGFDVIETELNKITDMKIVLSSKTTDRFQTSWVWKTSFKLSEDSEIRKILKIQNDIGDGTYVDNSIFYKNHISEKQKDEIWLDSFVDGEYSEIEYQKKYKQLEYQSSKWYWDEKEQTLTTIEKESNLNPYSTNGTNGGFSIEDSKRTKFAIDFVQHSSNITLYKPVFFFKTSDVIIKNTYISPNWSNFLKFKNYINDGDNEADEEKIKDIRIDLNCSYVEYEFKV